MATCETCHNEYENCFELTMKGETHYFDCFECAIHALAPHCEHCHCRVIGHGAEFGDKVFCCANCASNFGFTDAKDSLG